MGKLHVIKDYDKLDILVQQQIKLNYPEGFEDHLISFKNKEGLTVSALPFETESHYYLVRMTTLQAQIIIEDDGDYDSDGNLHDTIKEELSDKFD